MGRGYWREWANMSQSSAVLGYYETALYFSNFPCCSTFFWGVPSLSLSCKSHLSILVSLWPLATWPFPRPCQSGATALFVGAMNGHAEVVQLLLDGKADVNAENEVLAFVLFMYSLFVSVLVAWKSWFFKLPFGRTDWPPSSWQSMISILRLSRSWLQLVEEPRQMWLVRVATLYWNIISI